MRHRFLGCLALAAIFAATASAAEENSTLASKTGASSGAKENAHVVAESPSYIGMDPIYTTIIEGDSAVGLLMVGFGLDVPDETLRTKVNRMLPRLRDLYIRSLLSFTATNVRQWRRPDVDALAAKLQRVTDLLLKAKGAKILMAQVAVRLNK